MISTKMLAPITGHISVYSGLFEIEKIVAFYLIILIFIKLDFKRHKTKKQTKSENLLVHKIL